MYCLRLSRRLICLRLATIVSATVCCVVILAENVSAQSHNGVSAQSQECVDDEVNCANGSCQAADGCSALGVSGPAGCGQARGGGLLGRCGRGACALVGCQGERTHCGMPAPSYPVPFATPRNVTQTKLTYPPMMPHHSLPHYAGAYSFRHGPGMSRTNVFWRKTTGINTLQFLHHLFEIPR